MSTLPILPDIATTTELGGVKQSAFAVENPNTEASSQDWNQVVANVSGMTRTIQRAVVVFTIDVKDPRLDDGYGGFQTVWGVGNTPVLARIDSGEYTITFPVSVSDALIDSGLDEYDGFSNHGLSLWWAEATSYDVNGWSCADASLTAANVVTVRTWSYDGGMSQDDIDGLVVTVIAG